MLVFYDLETGKNVGNVSMNGGGGSGNSHTSKRGKSIVNKPQLNSTSSNSNISNDS
jgi:hypothetical protein